MEEIEQKSILSIFAEFNIETKVQKSPYEHIQCFYTDLADVLVVPGADESIVLRIAPDVKLDSDTAGQVEEIIQTRGYQSRLKFLEYSHASEDGLQILKQISSLAVFSRLDLSQIKKTTPLKSFLMGLLIRRSSLAALNPYTYQGPVTGSRFFGRSEELKTLLLQTGKSFVLSGVRRSGKTSVMMELMRQLRQTSSEMTVFVNFETCQTLSDVPYLILRHLAEELKSGPISLSEWSDNLLRLANSRQWKNPYYLSRLKTTIWGLVSSRQEAHHIRFLFDEYDRVITLEQSHDRVFTKIWRDLAMRAKALGKGQGSSVQFIFAGSRKLYEEILSTSSPFFNIGAEPLLLHNFELDTLNLLVVKPMRELGVEVQDAARIAQVLIEQTGGHPATTQHLLSLVVSDPQVEKVRRVGFEDILRAASRQEFLGLLRNTLDMNVSLTGRFILAQMAIGQRERVNLDSIQGVGRKHSIHFEDSALSNELQDLANSGYLRPLEFAAGQSLYTLAVPVLQRLFSSDDVPNLIQALLAKKLCSPYPK